ncbi:MULTISPECIES: Holliday junction resolvase-like protein [unclassified Acinetobacter]|uniref:Holliday junction resolvase-like protein n=1 Tax=unclassified Acinetobacter TaxID=196816 RepID=UPI0035B7144C
MNILLLALGVVLGVALTSLWFVFIQIRQVQAEHERDIYQLQQMHQQQIHELALQQQQQIQEAQKRSVNTSRAVLKGKMAEQFAPFFPEFHYLPSDAKFLGDPVDYVIFSGYHDFREGIIDADEIEIVLLDIKSGGARLSKGQVAIQKAIQQGRVRFESLRLDI